MFGYKFVSSSLFDSMKETIKSLESELASKEREIKELSEQKEEFYKSNLELLNKNVELNNIVKSLSDERISSKADEKSDEVVKTDKTKSKSRRRKVTKKTNNE